MADENQEERLKQALWFAVGKIADEESLRRNRNVTPQFIGALMELVWTQIGMLILPHLPPLESDEIVTFAAYYLLPLPHTTHLLTFSSEAVAQDLESFSRHAGRSTITTDDVLLLARRNEDLHGIIKDSIDKEKAAKAKSKARR
ncbi:hypothetical protein PG993_010358 [Apiospora rasikravindrae]|uniref:Centromere protein S n=1 Tax=Apiospora rasikravindrae TaxID=990691 RepID=A0ABR1SM04_9PEZI